MSKHTPGKWTAHLVPAHTMPDVPLPAEIRIDGRREISIYSSPWSIANAHLIAAAPDLLDALEYSLKCLQQSNIGTGHHQPAITAIAKAKGETS